MSCSHLAMWSSLYFISIFLSIYFGTHQRLFSSLLILQNMVNRGYSTVDNKNFASFRFIQPGRGADLLTCCHRLAVIRPHSLLRNYFARGSVGLVFVTKKTEVVANTQSRSTDPESRIPILCTLGFFRRWCLFSQHEELQELHIFLLPYTFGEYHRRISSFWHRTSSDSVDCNNLKRPLWDHFKKILIYPQEDEATHLDNLRLYMSPLHSQLDRIENWSTPSFYEDENWPVVSHIWRGSELFRWFT